MSETSTTMKPMKTYVGWDGSPPLMSMVAVPLWPKVSRQNQRKRYTVLLGMSSVLYTRNFIQQLIIYNTVGHYGTTDTAHS